MSDPAVATNKASEALIPGEKSWARRSRWWRVLVCVSALQLPLTACNGDACGPDESDAIVGLIVSPDTVRLEVGDTTRFYAYAVHESGDTTAGPAVTWISLKPAVATADAGGLATAVSAGIAKVIAATQGFSAEAIVKVAGWFSLPSLPVPLRNGHVACLEGKVYYVGGYTNVYVATTYIFEPSTESWSSAPAMPTARADGVIAVVGGRIFVIGGTNPDAPNNGYSRLWANEGFRAADGVWEVREPMPTARGHMAGDTLGGLIYVVGGSTVVEVYDTLEVYDPNSDAWTVGPSMPTTRWNVAGASVGDKLYVAGGEVSRMVATGALEVFDPSTQTWSAGPAMPTARFKAGSAVLDGRLVVVGGDNGEYLSVVEAFDPVKGNWSTLPSLPVPTRQARACVLDGVLYVLGGETAVGVSNRADALIP